MLVVILPPEFAGPGLSPQLVREERILEAI